MQETLTDRKGVKLASDWDPGDGYAIEPGSSSLTRSYSINLVIQTRD